MKTNTTGVQIGQNLSPHSETISGVQINTPTMNKQTEKEFSKIMLEWIEELPKTSLTAKILEERKKLREWIKTHRIRYS